MANAWRANAATLTIRNYYPFYYLGRYNDDVSIGN